MKGNVKAITVPEKSDEEKAKELLEQKRVERENRAISEINRILKENNCYFDFQMMFSSAANKSEWNLHIKAI